MRVTLEQRVFEQLGVERSLTAEQIATQLHIARVGFVRAALARLLDEGRVRASPGLLYFSRRV